MKTLPLLLLALAAGPVAAQDPAPAQTAPIPAQAQLSPSPPPDARPDRPSPASQQYRAMDGNNDGLVSSSEFEDSARSMFDAMDADKDDDVTLAEVEAARQRISGRVPGLSAGAAARKIRAMDTNADGVLSRTEHRDAASAMFRSTDRDNDGNLTTQEFDAAYYEILAELAP